MFASQKLMGGKFKPDFEYVGTNSDTTDATSYTFTDEPIGAAHAHRMVVVTISQGDANAGSGWTNSVTIGGVAATVVQLASITRQAGRPFIAYLKVPTGTTATIVITRASGTVTPNNCVIGVYRFNTLETTTVDEVTAESGSNTATASDVECVVDGIAFYCGCAQTGTASATWNGTDSIVQNRTAEFDGDSHGHGYVLTTEDSTVRDFAITMTGSAETKLVAASFRF